MSESRRRTTTGEPPVCVECGDSPGQINTKFRDGKVCPTCLITLRRTNATSDNPSFDEGEENADRRADLLEIMRTTDQTWFKAKYLATQSAYSVPEVAASLTKLRNDGHIEPWKDGIRQRRGTPWRLTTDGGADDE